MIEWNVVRKLSTRREKQISDLFSCEPRCLTHFWSHKRMAWRFKQIKTNFNSTLWLGCHEGKAIEMSWLVELWRRSFASEIEFWWASRQFEVCLTSTEFPDKFCRQSPRLPSAFCLIEVKWLGTAATAEWKSKLSLTLRDLADVYHNVNPSVTSLNLLVTLIQINFNCEKIFFRVAGVEWERERKSARDWYFHKIHSPQPIRQIDRGKSVPRLT